MTGLRAYGNFPKKAESSKWKSEQAVAGGAVLKPCRERLNGIRKSTGEQA